MKKAIFTISILTSVMVISCGGPASEAMDVCECFEAAKNEEDSKAKKEMLEDCEKKYKEIKEKYKEDEDAWDEIKETCDIF